MPPVQARLPKRARSSDLWDLVVSFPSIFSLASVTFSRSLFYWKRRPGPKSREHCSDSEPAPGPELQHQQYPQLLRCTRVTDHATSQHPLDFAAVESPH